MFSELECQVLRLESAGLPVAEIAVRLGVTERSVRDARHRARSRLGGEPLADLVSLLVS